MDEETGDEILVDLKDIIELVRMKDVEELYESFELGHDSRIIEKGNSMIRFEL